MITMMLAAPRDFLACCLVLVIIVLHCAVGPALASPLRSLSERENSYHLKCTNAQTVVAGNFLDPKDATANITNAPATCQAEYKYLFCTPNTKTYIFFGVIPSPPNNPAYATTLQSVTSFVAQHIRDDGPDSLLQNGAQYFITRGSDVQVYAQDAPKHNLTYGVLEAALLGLDAWMRAPANAYSDATFQVNEGGNWVGSGYVGRVNGEGECVFTGSLHPNQTCAATDEDGYIYGYDGGRFCDA